MQRSRMFMILIGILACVVLGSADAFAQACPDDPNDDDNGVVCNGVCDPGSNPCTACNPGEMCSYTNQPAGFCPTVSAFECQGTTPVCADPGEYNPAVPEGWLSPADPNSCSDGLDNDCDGLTDLADTSGATSCTATAEICDGFDSDLNGVADDNLTLLVNGVPMGTATVSDVCTEGIGVCERTGVVVCNAADATQTSVICSAHPGPAKQEALGIGNSCSDGLDNDCDGLTDDNDPDCQPVASAEICDGVDNNLNGQIDDGFTLADGTPIGDSCTVGLGQCANTGTVVCGDINTAVCNAFALTASVEGASGPTCSDGIDNDCDGLTDGNDPGCAAAVAGLRVTCSLPYLPKPGIGEPGGDCNGKHTIQYAVFNNNGPVDPNSLDVFRVELLGLSPSGELLGILPTSIDQGEQVHMSSRLSPSDFKMASKKGETRHEVFAPVPMLRVTARQGETEVQAVCSNIPYLDVTRPNGALVSVSGGDTTKVVVALPRVRPETLLVKVDGVDILAQMGITPADLADGQHGPVSDTVNINGQLVDVVDLVVDAGLSIDQDSSNTLTMTLKNLGGGGHIVFVDGEPQDFVQKDPSISNACYQDDIKDAGTVSVLEVMITEPADQQEVPLAPVQVTGEVKHGADIATLKLNGKGFDVTGEAVFTPGDGENTADQYVLNFDETLPLVNLGEVITGTSQALGTVQRGSNRLVAEANDEVGTRAFDTVVFAAGDVAHTEIPNTFVAGIEKSAIDAVFDNLCQKAVNEFTAAVQTHVVGQDLGTIDIEPTCAPDVHAPLVFKGIDVGPNFSCDTAFSGPVGPGGEIGVTVTLPPVSITLAANKSRETTFLGACVARTRVKVEATTTISNAVFNFTITEDQIKNGTPPTDDQKSFAFDVRFPGGHKICATDPNPPHDVQCTDQPVSDDLEHDVAGIWNNDSGIECLGAAVCNLFVGVGAVFAEVFTLGFADTSGFFGDFDFALADFTDLAGSTEPDPFGLENVKIDEQEVEEFGRATFTPALDAVDITGPPDVSAAAAGVTASFKTEFDTQVVDTTLEQNPGAVLTPAAPPTLPQGNVAAQNAFVVLADDSINQLFASLAESGGLKTVCTDTGKTINDLLPPDCEDLTIPDDPSGILTASAQGACHGLRAADCNTIPVAPLDFFEQGVCQAVKGGNCLDLTNFFAQPICQNFPNPHLSASNALLFCATQDMPPQLLIPSVGGGVQIGNLATTLLLNDLSVAIVVDRGTPTGAVDGELSGVANCFASDAAATADCNLAAACVDLTVQAEMSLDNSGCGPGETGFVFGVKNVSATMDQFGYVCGVAPNPTNDEDVTTVVGQDQTIDEIVTNVDAFTPPLCAKGLDLNGILTFLNPKLISIHTNGADANLADYFGIIGEIQ
jgi:hypothetical protein